ncbi:HTTM domain-containing protein [Mycobacterium hubeiense]|uniref:HTTM domain-containing protein n=1 Tax=Mycobacterium hubeiense TaxID=1867256 RepID=UPI000C7EC4A5|nr:HTTM domain-containing protein [Mycobacterium sp. QGD 101]
MMERVQRQRPVIGALIDGWCAFWFTPQLAYTFGLVRMTFGVVAVGWTLALLPDLFQVFGEQGVAPQYPLLGYQWSVFEVWSSDRALLIGWALLLLSALALALGWHSRLAAVLVFVLIQSFHQRGDYVFNAGDAILTIVALILALSSCGAALSLDQHRRSGSFWSAETRAPWPIRLMQVQLTLIYLVTVQAKLAGRSWVDGSAVFFAWRTDGRWATLTTPEWLASNAILINVLTWGTLLIELAIAIFVWNRRWRFWALGTGVVMHLTMMLNLNVAFFSLAMFVLYFAFVPWEAVEQLPAKLRSMWSRRPHSSPSLGPDRPVNDSVAEPIQGS